MYFNLIVHWGGFTGRAEQCPPPSPVFPVPSCFLTNLSFDRYRCFIVYTVIRVFYSSLGILESFDYTPM